MAASIRIGRGYIEIDADTDRATRAVNSFAKSSGKVMAGAAAVIASSGAGIAAAIGGIGVAFAGLGILAASANEDVANAFNDLWGQIVSGAQSAAEPLTPVLIGIAQDFSDLNAEVQPQLRDMFEAAGPAIESLSSGVQGFVRMVMPALTKSIQAQGPVFTAFGRLIEDAGAGLADFLTAISSESAASARSIEAFGNIIRTALSFAGNLLVQFASHGAPLIEQLSATFSQLTTTVLSLSSGALPVLVGAVSGGLNILSGLLTLVGGNAQAMGTLVGVVLSLVATFRLLDAISFGGLGARLGELTTSVRAAEGAKNKLKTAANGLASGLGLAGIAVGGLGVLLSVLGDRQQRAAERAAEHRNRIESLTRALADNGGEITDNIAAEQIQAATSSKLFDITSRLGVSRETLTQALIGNRGAIEDVNAAFDRAGIGLQQFAGNGDQLVKTFGDIAGSDGLGTVSQVTGDARRRFDELSGAMVTAQGNTRGLAAAQTEAAIATRDHTSAIAKQIDQALAAANTDLGYRQSLVQLRDAQKQAEAAISEHGAASEEAADEILNLEQAMLRTLSAAKEKAVADNAGKSAADQAKAANKALSDEFQRLASNSSPAAQAALENIVQSMDGTQLAALDATAGVNDVGRAVAILPGGKTVEIDANTAEALRKASQVNIALNDAARQRTAFIDVVSRATGQAGRGVQVPHAQGGAFYGSRPMLVGENGPEYIFPDRGGFVATARQTEALQRNASTFAGSSAQGISVTQNITPRPDASSQEIADQTIRALNFKLRYAR